MTVKNWAGNVTFRPEQLAAPRTVEELQELIAGSTKIRALGTGHSFNRIADTDGVLVTTRELPAHLDVDEATGTATVPAGARYGEVAAALHERGWALPNLGSLPHISIAGACATGTHGSGNGNQCQAAAVRGIEFVRADGELARIAAGDDDFGGAALNLGALGIATRVTLAVEPTYEVTQDVWLDAPADEVLANYAEISAAAYSVSLFNAPDTPGRIDQIWLKRRGGEPVDGRRWGATAADRDVHPIAGQDARAATPQQGEPGPWHERLPHFRASFTPSAGDEQQSEFFVARSDGPAAIAALLALDLSDALLVNEFRTIAADDLWLSPFRERESTALHFTWRDDDELVRAALVKVHEALAPFDARPHWGKVFHLDRDEVQRHYPHLAGFRALVAKHDPERKFGNEYLETYVY